MTRMGLQEISVSGIWLHRDGDYVIVEVERKMADGTYQWYEVIREHSDGAYSHIIEPNGIQSRFQRVSEPSSGGPK